MKRREGRDALGGALKSMNEDESFLIPCLGLASVRALGGSAGIFGRALGGFG